MNGSTSTPQQDLRKRIDGGPWAFFGQEREAFATAIDRAEQAQAQDDTYWEQLATGQDTEEAESSGYLVGYAAGLRDAARIMLGQPTTEEADSACDCGGRGWYVMATNGDDSRDWIERCDDCRRFPSDEEAARAAAAETGRTISHAYLATAGQNDEPRPYLIDRT